jgi:phage terminase small subunit
MLELTPEIQTKIEGFVRAGATPLSAAKAAGIDADSYAKWMELADTDSRSHREFRHLIEMAEAETRTAAEIELRRKNPKAWLQRPRLQGQVTRRPAAKAVAVKSPKGTNGLTPKQQRFVIEFLKDFNGTQAATRAGYSARTANEQAARLLTQAPIAATIAHAMKKAFEKAGLDLARWVREVWNMALLDPADFYDADGNLLPIQDMPIEARRALAGMDLEELFDYERGEKIPRGILRKIRFATKAPYFEMLGKYFRVWGQSLEITGKNGAPITIVHLLERLGPIPEGISRGAALTRMQPIEIESTPIGVAKPTAAAVPNPDNKTALDLARIYIGNAKPAK